MNIQLHVIGLTGADMAVIPKQNDTAPTLTLLLWYALINRHSMDLISDEEELDTIRYSLSSSTVALPRRFAIYDCCQEEVCSGDTDRSCVHSNPGIGSRYRSTLPIVSYD